VANLITRKCDSKRIKPVEAASKNQETPNGEEAPVQKLQKQYERPRLIELGSLAKLSQTDIFLSVGGG
jgi:hypothetical protein